MTPFVFAVIFLLVAIIGEGIYQYWVARCILTMIAIAFLSRELWY